METAASRSKNRVLPVWMTAQMAECVRPTKSPKRRRTAMARTASAERLPATRTVYCMNEAELVDVALGILIEGRKQEERWEQQVLAGADKLELSLNHSPGGQSDADDNGEDALPLSHGPSQGLGRADPVCSQSQEEEEDALKYVREIFFN